MKVGLFASFSFTLFAVKYFMALSQLIHRNFVCSVVTPIIKALCTFETLNSTRQSNALGNTYICPLVLLFVTLSRCAFNADELELRVEAGGRGCLDLPLGWPARLAMKRATPLATRYTLRHQFAVEITSTHPATTTRAHTRLVQVSVDFELRADRVRDRCTSSDATSSPSTKRTRSGCPFEFTLCVSE